MKAATLAVLLAVLSVAQTDDLLVVQSVAEWVEMLVGRWADG